MNAIFQWLNKRFDHSLHAVQLSALSSIVNKLYHNMSLQGLDEHKLGTKTFHEIKNRLKVEESSNATPTTSTAGASGSGTDVLGGEPGGQPSNFTSSLLSSLTSSTGSSLQSATCQTPTTPQTTAHHTATASAGSLQMPTSIGSRSFSSRQQPTATNAAQQTNAAEPADLDSNLADRALQSASRMFKGFWATQN